jgi:hypothetical protein
MSHKNMDNEKEFEMLKPYLIKYIFATVSSTHI